MIEKDCLQLSIQNCLNIFDSFLHLNYKRDIYLCNSDFKHEIISLLQTIDSTVSMGHVNWFCIQCIWYVYHTEKYLYLPNEMANANFSHKNGYKHHVYFVDGNINRNFPKSVHFSNWEWHVTNNKEVLNWCLYCTSFW